MAHSLVSLKSFAISLWLRSVIAMFIYMLNIFEFFSSHKNHTNQNNMSIPPNPNADVRLYMWIAIGCQLSFILLAILLLNDFNGDGDMCVYV